MKPYVDYRTRLIDSLKDEEEARAYLEAAFEEFEADQDAEILLMALRNVAEAKGSIEGISIRLKDDPAFGAIAAILDVLGYRITLQPKSLRAAS